MPAKLWWLILDTLGVVWGTTGYMTGVLLFFDLIPTRRPVSPWESGLLTLVSAVTFCQCLRDVYRGAGELAVEAYIESLPFAEEIDE